VRIHLGIDDTDSPSGGCTTKIATDLVLSLVRKGVMFTDYPNLIRLNPNVPWKTRGNAAVCIRIETVLNGQSILESALQIIERRCRFAEPGTDPAVVMLEGEVPSRIVRFSEDTLTQIMDPDEAISIARDVGATAIAYRTSCGIVGALAAIGAMLANDHTYELIAYRSRGFIGRPRLVDKDRVFEMDRQTCGSTFNNIDPETGRVLLTPHGPDPILCGIRGESPDAVRRGFQMLCIREPVDAWMIFRSNQGTDAHLVRDLAVSQLKDNCTAVVTGRVREKPHTIRGGHVIFRLDDDTGSVHCAAYEPTGKFREIVRMLEPQDKVRIFGGVRPASKATPRTMNLEKLEVLEAARCSTLRNPRCPTCGKSMKSAGRTQGFRCKRCGTHESSKVLIETSRLIRPGVYLPPPRAHRHLTKPHVRYGRECSETTISPTTNWHYP